MSTNPTTRRNPKAPPGLEPILIEPYNMGARGGQNGEFAPRADRVLGPATGLPCPACGSPRDAQSRFCVACGLPFEVPDEVPRHEKWGSYSRQTPASGNSPSERKPAASGSIKPPHPNTQAALPSNLFHCQNCGSDVETSIEQRSFHCPFCDSAYVTEINRDSAKRQRPEFIIGFSVTREQAQEKYLKWIGRNSWFRPGDLNIKAVSEKQKGVYIPFWHFSISAQSQWSAQIGQYWYRTETYTVTNSKGQKETRTRMVQETEWWPLSGRHRAYYSGFMVSGSAGLPQNEALAIQPYDLNELVRYKPYYLAGWLSEEYSVAAEHAINIATQEFRNREARSVGSKLPGDTQAGLSVSTDFDLSGTDLILLPVHVLSYRYRDQVYRFLVNGQTGKIYGEKPWSAKRIGAAIAVVMILIGVVVTLVTLATSTRSN
jgi:hypothetical protein